MTLQPKLYLMPRDKMYWWRAGYPILDIPEQLGDEKIDLYIGNGQRGSLFKGTFVIHDDQTRAKMIRYKDLAKILSGKWWKENKNAAPIVGRYRFILGGDAYPYYTIDEFLQDDSSYYYRDILKEIIPIWFNKEHVVDELPNSLRGLYDFVDFFKNLDILTERQFVGRHNHRLDKLTRGYRYRGQVKRLLSSDHSEKQKFRKRQDHVIFDGY